MPKVLDSTPSPSVTAREWYQTCTCPVFINPMEHTQKLLPIVLVFAVLGALTGCARSPQQKYARFVDSGKKYLHNRDYGRAILEFNNASKIDSRNPEVHYLLGLAFLGTDNVRNAAAQFNQ